MEIQNKKLSDDVFYKERAEVLTQWPTGKDVDLEEAVAYHKNMPLSRNFSTVQIRAGLHSPGIPLPIDTYPPSDT